MNSNFSIFLSIFFRLINDSRSNKNKENKIVEDFEDQKGYKELWHKIKKELKIAGYLSTLSSIPNILMINRLYVKLIWIICLFISLGFCIFMIHRTVVNYLQFDLTSQIRQNPQESVKFPSISFCNPNNLATTEGTKYFNKYYFDNYRVNLSNFDQVFAFLNEDFFYLTEWLRYQPFLPSFNKTLRQSLSYSLEEMIISCQFDSKPCNLSWFEWFSHSVFGNCYYFNTGFINEGK